MNELVRLGARKLVQELLEAEGTESLGRVPYQRRAGAAPSGYRNGYKPRHLDTAEGRLEIELPQVRDTEEAFRSTLWTAMRRRTEVLARFWSAAACTDLVHAVLWRASERWRRVTFSALERRQIEQYRRLRPAQKGSATLAAAATVA